MTLRRRWPGLVKLDLEFLNVRVQLCEFICVRRGSEHHNLSIYCANDGYELSQEVAELGDESFKLADPLGKSTSVLHAEELYTLWRARI